VAQAAPEVPSQRSTDFVQSVERALAVILAFDAQHPVLTAAEVARRTNLPRAAARRFLLTLVELGYLRSDGSRFALQPRILELGFAYLSGLELPEVALPHLEELARRLDESCSLAILDGDEVVYVARVASARPLSFSIRVGTRFPAYATSMGRVLLAAMPDEWVEEYLARTRLAGSTRHTITDPEVLKAVLKRSRDDGYVFVDQELQEGLRSVAVPLHSPEGRVCAAVNVTAHANQRSAEETQHVLLPPLRETVRAIEANLRGSHWSYSRLAF
jgi:IclR family transcriptional regulator, pca regulon regulatory protein